MPRKRRALWKRRRTWVVVLAVAAALLLTFWLIQNISNYRPPD
jgi:hypothetical protein